MAASVRNSKSGVTLVELMIAMAIIFIIFLGLTQSGLVALEYNIKNSLRDEAVSVADNVINTDRGTPFAALQAAPAMTNAPFPRQVRGMSITYRVTRPTPTPLDANNLLDNVTVSWTRADPFTKVQRTYTYGMATIVRNQGTL